jgi:hypothetical protein
VFVIIQNVVKLSVVVPSFVNERFSIKKDI